MDDSRSTTAPEWLIAAVVGVGGFGGGIALDRLVSSLPGDPLAFGGALLGAAAAVTGAEIVATRHRRAERREARAFQYEMLTRIRDNINVITADFRPDPNDAHAFNAAIRNIPTAISGIRHDSSLLGSSDIQKSAGWNVAICQIPRLVDEALPGLTRFDNTDIANGHQPALAVAMAQAIGDLSPVRMQVERCMIDLRPRFGPPRR